MTLPLKDIIVLIQQLLKAGINVSVESGLFVVKCAIVVKRIWQGGTKRT